jgi:hypothetical protein
MFPIKVSRRRGRGSTARKLSRDSPRRGEAHHRYGPYNTRKGAR